jgi:tetratricopeptide (TPR) repeat protein
MQVALLFGGCADAPEKIGEWIGDVLDQVVIVPGGSEMENRVIEALGRSGEDPGWLLVPVEREMFFDATDPAAADVGAAFEKIERRLADRFEARSAVAFELQASDKLDAAEKLYRSLDAMLGSEASPRHAFLLVTLSGLAEAQGKPADAAAWLDRALAIAPGHLGALRARARLAHDLGLEAVAAAMIHRIIHSSESDFKRIEMLMDIGRESLDAARRALGEAADLKKGDQSLLERLQAVHEAAGDWEKAVGVGVRIAEAT